MPFYLYGLDIIWRAGGKRMHDNMLLHEYTPFNHLTVDVMVRGRGGMVMGADPAPPVLDAPPSTISSLINSFIPPPLGGGLCHIPPEGVE